MGHTRAVDTIDMMRQHIGSLLIHACELPTIEIRDERQLVKLYIIDVRELTSFQPVVDDLEYSSMALFVSLMVTAAQARVRDEYLLLMSNRIEIAPDPAVRNKDILGRGYVFPPLQHPSDIRWALMCQNDVKNASHSGSQVLNAT
jgi:hypothetical protein